MNPDGTVIDDPASPGGIASLSPNGISPAAAALGCTPSTAVDNPHRSSTSAVPRVQSHGTWDLGSCTSAKTAHVQVCLYEYYTTSAGDYWVLEGCATSQLKPSRSNGNRTTAGVNCADETSTGWLSVGDTDVDGMIDTSETAQSVANPNCRVYS